MDHRATPQTRHAVALSFLSAGAWDKGDLARWLVSAYRMHVVPDEARAVATPPPPSFDTEPPVSSIRSRIVGDGELRRVILEARAEIFAVLAAAGAGDVDFAQVAAEMMASGIVRELPDGATVAVDQPRLKLSERVLSLIVADYVADPTTLDEVLQLVCA